MARSKRKSSFSLRQLLYLLLATLIVSLSVGGLLLSGYVVQLDQEIRTRFAGSRWALPAQVYAAAVDLYPGRQLEPAELRRELDRLGYRHSPALTGPGTYVAGEKRIEVAIRGFRFWDAEQPDLRLAVRFEDRRIAAIDDLEAGAPRDIVRLDPMLIGSIYPQSQAEDRVLVRVTDAEDAPVMGLTLDGVLRHPASTDLDHVLVFTEARPGVYSAPVEDLPLGSWTLHAEAVDADAPFVLERELWRR